ncbi:TetR/AcrR family transcriptional regulator [Nocardia caishijiensis]|uniref:TetR family transcriptional regulator n=1 Tax=Nocardia caishijiensis TaxID=184756 RepID=A0ABQ6YGJ4_9NOCA|nr:TetR/AcrR family transcriptional regulator [Nocardia caishijiensis]KAF0844912.1 TetR family transcriptional regulator [Nocardia caishijiensis]
MSRSTPDVTRRNEASRRAILTAAFELAGEIGYAKLTIEAVAARAGVGKQTIYRWWPSKGAVLLDSFLLLSEAGGENPGLPDTGDLAADLTLVLRATVDELTDPHFDLALRGLTSAILDDDELAVAYRDRLQAPVDALKRRRLESARTAGEIADDIDLDVAVAAVWGPVLDRWLLRTGPLTHDFADRVVTTALRGLRPRKPGDIRP